MLPKRQTIAILLWLVAFLIGCSPQPQPTPDTVMAPTATATPAPTPTRAFVPPSISVDTREQVSLRFINAAAGLDTLDIYAEQLTLASRLRFGTSSAGAQIVGGDYVLSVFPGGSATDGEPLLRAALTLEGGNRYTMLLTNVDDRVRLAAIPDDDTLLPSGQSRLLVIHAAPTLGTVDVGLRGEVALITDLPFSESSPSITLPTGRVTLQARPEAAPSIETTVNMRDGFAYTLILQGDQAQWVEFEDRVPGQAFAYFVNALDPSLGAVDIYLDDNQVGSALVFGAASDQAIIAAETSTLRVVPAGSPPEARALVESSIAVNSNDFAAFVVVGDAASASVVSAVNARQAAAADQSTITFLNAYPNADQMRNSGEGIIDQRIELPYGIPVTIDTLAGNEQFYWRESPEPVGSTTEFFDPRDFAGGTSYLYVLTGREEAPVLVFERAVPLEDTTPATILETATVRWINTIPGAAVTFTLGDAAQVENLAYGQQQISAVPSGSYLLSVASGASRSQATVAEFAGFDRVSIYSFGTVEDPYLLLVEDETSPTLNEDMARLRLTYIAPLSTERSLTLAFSPSSSDAMNSAFEAEASEGGPTDLPFGAQTLVRRTAAGQTSLAGQLLAGNYDLYLIDDLLGRVVLTIRAAPLEGNTLYEIIAVQSLFSAEVSVLAVEVQPSS